MMANMGTQKAKIALSSNTAQAIYNFRLGVVKNLLSQGYEVFIIAPKDATVDKLVACGCTFVEVTIESRGVNPFKDVRLLRQYIQLYRAIQPHFIFHFTIKPAIYGTFAAKIVGVPSISVITGLGYVFIHENWIAKIARLLYRQALKFSLEVWFLNKDDLQLFVKQKLIPLDKGFVLPGEGVDTNFFSPRGKIKQEKLIFLMIARLIWDKGIKEFVEAARIIKAKYSHIEFQLLGEKADNIKNGVPQPILDQWVADGLVTYLGAVQDVRDFIAQASCVVLPSYREGIPRSLLEASSMAIPIIATDTVGCREVVLNQKSGLLCKVGNSRSLADQMEHFILMNNHSKKEMGLIGRQYIIDRFDESKVINIYLEKLKKFNVSV